MHRPIRPLSAALALCFALHALFAADYEQGWARVTSPVFLFAFSAACWGVFVRGRWAWPIVAGIGLTFPIINFVFPPRSTDFGQHYAVVRPLIWVEVFICLLLAFAMLWPRSQDKYFHSGQ